MANGSPARLRACRARSLSPRCPRLYGVGFALYLTLTRSRAFLCISPPPPGAPRGSVTKPRTALQTPIADWRGPWRLPCACSRLTDVCSELCTCKLRVKSAVTLLYKYNSLVFLLRRPSGPSAVGSDVDQPGGTDPTSGRRHVRAIRKPLGVSRSKRGLKGGSYSWHSDSTPTPGRAFGAFKSHHISGSADTAPDLSRARSMSCWP